MKNLFLIPFLLIIIPSAYAQEDETGILGAIDGFFEWVGTTGKQSISSSDMEQSQQELLANATDSGVEAGKSGVKFWEAVHTALVNFIFAGLSIAGFDVDKQMISVIAIILTVVLIGLIIWGLAKKSIYIGIAVGAIVIALGVAGIVIDF